MFSLSSLVLCMKLHVLCFSEYSEVKAGYRKTMSKLRVDPNDETNSTAAITGLKKLISNALKEKRNGFIVNAKSRIARQQSLKAIFQLKK